MFQLYSMLYIVLLSTFHSTEVLHMVNVGYCISPSAEEVSHVPLESVRQIKLVSLIVSTSLHTIIVCILCDMYMYIFNVFCMYVVNCMYIV